jgi:hypothetical protein
MAWRSSVLVLVIALIAVIAGGTSVAPDAGGARSVGAFFARTAAGRLAACDMYLPGSRQPGVLCASPSGGEPNVFQEARLLRGGRVQVCQSASGCPWIFDDPDPGPTLGVGARVTAGPFTCRVLATAVRCTVKSGKGFRINTHEVVEVGGSS